MIRRIVLLLNLLLVGASPSLACNVPVFRYALERWKPSPYEVFVFHKGPLPAEQQRLVTLLDEPATVTNVSVVAVDTLKPMDRETREVFNHHAWKATLPFVVVRYPSSRVETPSAWTGPLTEANVRGIMDSPARQRIVKLLARGESAVFVLVSGGDDRTDRTTLTKLKRDLGQTAKEIELPPIEKNDPDLLTDLPVKVSFPIVKVSRTDPREAIFAEMLVNSEDHLPSTKGPLVFPIFGRGRVLCGLDSEDLGEGEAASECRFLCAACSCKVKEQARGVDLLMAADWDELLQPREAAPEQEMPPITAPAIPPGTAEQLPEDATDQTTESNNRRWLWIGVFGAVALVVATSALLIRNRKRVS